MVGRKGYFLLKGSERKSCFLIYNFKNWVVMLRGFRGMGINLRYIYI